MAAAFKAAGTDIQGMFNDDIVGTSAADDGTRDRTRCGSSPRACRPPAPAHGDRQSVDGENDSASRQLARSCTEVAGRATGMDVRVIYRLDRFLRGGDHLSFLQQGYPAARFTEPHENFDHQHQDVRVENGVQFGDLPQFCDFHYVAGVARVNGAGLWSLAKRQGRRQCADPHHPADQRHHPVLGPPTRPASPATRCSGGPPSTRLDPRIPVGNVGDHHVDSPRTTCSSGCARSGRSGYHSPAAFPVPSS